MNQQSTEHTIPPQENTISMDEAISRTANWRTVFNSFDKTTVLQTPASIFISKEDLQELMTNFPEHDGYPFAGVRLYLSVSDATPGKSLYPVTGSIVPTVAVTSKGGDTYYQDVIIPVPIVNPDGSTGEGVSIYDVTQPCPSFCEGTTPALTGS